MDSFFVLGRNNARGIDLNRNFPSLFDKGIISELQRMSNKDIFNLPTKDPIQPETRAVMTWVLDNPFVLSISFHGGAVGSFFPYDDGPKPRGVASPTPDNELLKEFATLYSSNHEEMHKGQSCPRSPHRFPNGVSNGAKWYALSGGMTDFNYIFSNCFEITVELSCCKYPKDEELEIEWRNNKNSMMKYLESVHIGIKGIVSFENGTRSGETEIYVEDNKKAIKSTNQGEYWRLLPPGKYKIIAQHSIQKSLRSEIISVEVKPGEVLRQDLTLLF